MFCSQTELSFSTSVNNLWASFDSESLSGVNAVQSYRYELDDCSNLVSLSERQRQVRKQIDCLQMRLVDQVKIGQEGNHLLPIPNKF